MNQYKIHNQFSKQFEFNNIKIHVKDKLTSCFYLTSPIHSKYYTVEAYIHYTCITIFIICSSKLM